MCGADAFCRLVRPELTKLLELLHLDVTFTRASGCYVWPRGSDRPVLDLVGGYGSLLFGHNHPALVRAAVGYLRGQRPVHVQGSIKPLTGVLAARLAGDSYRVLFANSGAEAVEVALKHILLECPERRPIVALDGAFHGKTLGAVQLTANPEYRKGFEVGVEVVRVPPNDTAALREVFARCRPAALFLELVQGEGGVMPLTPEFVRLARELCSEAALVVDECQTGLGRTGKLLACEHFGLSADLVIVSKALGGGIAKLSAVLIRADRWRPELSMIHTSTYADDDFSSCVALRVLDLVTDEAMASCAETGRWLKDRLGDLAADYPDVVREVRGLGLLLGIELVPQRNGLVLPMIGQDLGLVVAGYLYHRHRIRVAPTLSNPLTLRVQPALVTPRRELSRFVAAMRDVCEKVRSGDVLGLTRYFLKRRTSTVATTAGGAAPCETVREGVCFYRTPAPVQTARAMPRVAWLFHLNSADDLTAAEPSFGELTALERADFLHHVERRVVPVVASSTEVTSRTGAAARFDAILLPLTAQRIRSLLDAGETRWLRALVQQGIDVAAQLGCCMVSLGQYTSVVMRNGSAVRPGPVGVTTGNAYAVALALEAVEEAAPKLAGCTVAVVGAAGNIGSAIARLLAPRCARLLLVGRDTPGAVTRMKRLHIADAQITTRLDDCRDAEVLIVAVSRPGTVIRGEHLATGALVCDLSVPAALDAAGRADVRIVCGGVAQLPGGEDFRIPCFPLAPGRAYGCMAEGLLLALEGVVDRSFTGPIAADKVRQVAALARKHGLTLAGSSKLAPPEVVRASA